MKKILVTGGSGFLGSKVVNHVKKNGYDVLAPRSKEFDLYDYKSVYTYIVDYKPEVVIHSAAYYGGIGINQTEPANLFHHNTLMTTNLYEACAKAGVKKIVAIGSSCSYPAIVKDDLKETDFWNGELHESVEAYGFSKKIQLVAQKAYYKQYGIEGNHLVLTNLYGEGDVFTEYRAHAIAALIKKITDAKFGNKSEVIVWGDGSPIREFLYVEDAASVIASAIKWKHNLIPVNIGTGVGTSIKELVEIICKLVGYSGSIVWDKSKPNGVARKVMDVSCLRNITSELKLTLLENGLSNTIEWYIENKKIADKRL